MILKYNDFLSEGLFNKAKELLNRSKLSSNDKIADKWISKIKEDYNKKKDLSKVVISKSKDYTRFAYVITDRISNSAIDQLSHNDYHIEILQINSNWKNDISGGRIEVTKFKDYKGEQTVVGRHINTREIISNDNGVKPDHDLHSYVNISQSKAKDIINFFLKEFHTKYPETKNYDRLSVQTIESIDKSYRTNREQLTIDDRNRRMIDREAKEKEVAEYFNKHSKYTREDISDLLVELEDMVEEKTIPEYKIRKFYYNNPTIGMDGWPYRGSDDKWVLKEIEDEFENNFIGWLIEVDVYSEDAREKAKNVENFLKKSTRLNRAFKIHYENDENLRKWSSPLSMYFILEQK